MGLQGSSNIVERTLQRNNLKYNRNLTNTINELKELADTTKNPNIIINSLYASDRVEFDIVLETSENILITFTLENNFIKNISKLRNRDDTSEVVVTKYKYTITCESWTREYTIKNKEKLCLDEIPKMEPKCILEFFNTVKQRCSHEVKDNFYYTKRLNDRVKIQNNVW